MIERIVVATDFSECARAAVDFGLELATKQSAQVTILHAWVAPRILSGVEAAPLLEMPGLPGVTLTQYVHDDAERELRELVSELERQGARGLERHLVLGDPRNVIVAASGAADLVVMGTHGRGGLARVMLGSVADYVVRHAECPVLTVRMTKPRAS